MDDLQENLAQHQHRLSAFLRQYLASKNQEFEAHAWGKDVIARLDRFVVAGKLLRGSLLLLVFDWLSGEGKEVLPAAAALELTQSGLLIHDDIIDRDQLRRGKPAIHAQYQQLATQRNYQDPAHQGTSLGICLGDITFFLSFELLNNLDRPSGQLAHLNQLFARELSLVGLAEMQDIHQGLTSEPVTEAEVEFLYRYKTGRYSFSLPLMMGAVLAQAPQTVIKQLETLGEVMGLLFQIKDDELGLFGTEQEIGKSASSDLKEGKKTLYYLYALELAAPPDQQRLKVLVGKPDLITTEADEARAIITRSGAKAKVEQKLTALNLEAVRLIEAMELTKPAQQGLVSLVEFLSHRRK